jgi:hypothetical protein
MGNLTNKAALIFDTHEKWESFNELIKTKDEIIKLWYDQLKTKMVNKIQIDDRWEERYFGTGVKWFLKDFDEYHISIWLEKEYFSLYSDSNYIDNSKVYSELKNKAMV